MTKKLNLISSQEISQLCKQLLPDRENTALLNKLKTIVGHENIRLGYTSNEWFQVGGIIDANGQSVSNDMIEWIERTYLESGQDLQVLIEHVVEQQLVATKISGKTLFYIVETGPKAEDFILIEIDKLQEKSDRLLISEADLPESMEDMIDPLNPEHVDSFNIGPASYTYKRKTDIAVFMQSLAEHHTEIHPLQRFINDWNQTSAAKTRFSDDWMIRPLQHIGRYGESVLNAELINLRTQPLSQLEELVGKHGNNLYTILKRFDRKAGYDFAWYFYMVKGILVSSQSAEAVYQDVSGDFAYLPECDEKVLKAWMASPYYIH